jgi:hypothetical protein
LFILGFGVRLAEEVHRFLVVLVRHVWVLELSVLRVYRGIESSGEFLESCGSKKEGEAKLEMMACRQNIRA